MPVRKIDRVYTTIKNNVTNNTVSKIYPASQERRFQHNDDKDWTGYLGDLGDAVRARLQSFVESQGDVSEQET